MAETRCQDCCDLGLECPRGYRVTRVECTTCGRKVVLVAANCNDNDPVCDRCNAGTLEPVEDV